MEELFKLIGLGVPFYLAAATYAVFFWLDSNASDEATKVISSWLHGRSHNKPDLGNLIISAFDRIYTSPLLTFRAFRRSTAISSIIWSLLWLVPTLVRSSYTDLDSTDFVIWSTNLIAVILSDYISLFVVRKCLNFARAYPIKASVTAAAAGALIVVISYQVFYLAEREINELLLGPQQLSSWVLDIFRLWFLLLIFHDFVPAFIIHLWLPLFALSLSAVRLVFLLFRAVEWAQWFIKEGDAHPLKAIGIVATIIVFGSAMLVKEAWTVL